VKTVAIIQARMGSTRLPGKVLKPLGNKSVLERVIERAKAAEKMKKLWWLLLHSPKMKK